MSFKTPALPTLPKIKSAWEMALWMAALNISYALIVGSFSAVAHKLAAWKHARDAKKMHAKIMEQMKTPEVMNQTAEIKFEEVEANA
jgi:hypothetical protein